MICYYKIGDAILWAEQFSPDYSLIERWGGEDARISEREAMTEIVTRQMRRKMGDAGDLPEYMDYCIPAGKGWGSKLPAPDRYNPEEDDVLKRHGLFWDYADPKTVRIYGSIRKAIRHLNPHDTITKQELLEILSRIAYN